MKPNLNYKRLKKLLFKPVKVCPNLKKDIFFNKKNYISYVADPIGVFKEIYRFRKLEGGKKKIAF